MTSLNTRAMSSSRPGTRRRRALTAAASGIAVALVGVGCSTPAPGASPGGDQPGQVIEIQVSHNQGETHYTQEKLQAVADRVAEETDGAVKLTVFSSSQLGSIPDLIDQAMSGTDVITLHNMAQAAERGVPSLAAVSAMYTFNAPDGQSGPAAIYPQIQKLLASDLMKGWKEELAAQGFILLTGNWYLGERQTFTDNPDGHPSPEDLRGVTLRIPDGSTWQAFFNQTPATVVTMDGSEVYTSMQQGALNGSEGPYSQMIGWSLPELTKSVTLTGHGNDTQGFMMGQQTWDKLSPEQQQVLVDAFVWGGDEFSKQTIANVESDRKMLEDLGINFVEADLAAYRALADKAYTAETFPDWDPDVRQKIREASGQ